MPSAMEPLLKRIAEGVERLERKQPPSVPGSMAGDSPPPMPSSSRQPDSPPPNLSPQQFANAGNINIEGKGKDSPSVFGRAAISLQSMTNMMADYGVRTPPAMHQMTSFAKVASLMAGDIHTRGESLASRGMRPSTGGDQDQMLRSLELGSKGNRNQLSGESDSSPQIAGNDLKDSIDSLKEAIDQLKDALKDTSPGKQSGGPKTMMRQTAPAVAQAGGQRSRPTQLGSVNPDAVRGIMRAFGL